MFCHHTFLILLSYRHSSFFVIVMYFKWKGKAPLSVTVSDEIPDLKNFELSQTISIKNKKNHTLKVYLSWENLEKIFCDFHVCVVAPPAGWGGSCMKQHSIESDANYCYTYNTFLKEIQIIPFSHWQILPVWSSQVKLPAVKVFGCFKILVWLGLIYKFIVLPICNLKLM